MPSKILCGCGHKRIQHVKPFIPPDQGGDGACGRAGCACSRFHGVTLGPCATCGHDEVEHIGGGGCGCYHGDHHCDCEQYVPDRQATLVTALDDICKCGHVVESHFQGEGICLVKGCACQKARSKYLMEPAIDANADADAGFVVGEGECIHCGHPVTTRQTGYSGGHAVFSTYHIGPDGVPGNCGCGCTAPMAANTTYDTPASAPAPAPAPTVGFDGQTTHYGSADDPYEAIKVIEAWGLGFSLGSAVKYICRAPRRDTTTAIKDLTKAAAYIGKEIERLKRKQ